MHSAVRLCNVAMVCLLVSQVSGHPTDMQSDDWNASTFLASTLNQYVRPYTTPLVERVTSSRVWDVFGKTIDGLQGAINLTGEYLHTYYEDHIKAPTENTMQWIGNKTKPIVERVRGRFQRDQQ